MLFRSLLPFHNTVAPAVNRDPFTVKAKLDAPDMTTAGERLLRVGAPDVGAATVMLTVAALPVWVIAFLSVAVKLKLSEPVYPVVGVNTKFGDVPVKTPCAGLEVTV